eukprot:3175473-Prorocentrum_lima.AAC.1
MTSSLVGSEMCIRDRLFGSFPRPTVSRQPGKPPPPSPLRYASIREVFFCLLYTSDAADDI